MGGFSINVEMMGDDIRMFLTQKLDVCIMFGKLVDSVSGIGGGKARDRVVLLLSMWLLPCVIEWKELSSKLMWVRVRELGVYMYQQMDEY